MPGKVLVSGCFDLLHSGHVAFFEEAASYGDLYVAVGSDRTVMALKGRRPVNSEAERLYLVRSLAVVKEAFISTGSGVIDFAEEARALRPDVFVVNEDGHSAEKQRFIEALGARYVVLERVPRPGLPPRSTTALREVDEIPYRIDLAGGWLDQPFVSRCHPGPVVTVSIEPTRAYNARSGMATSTRRSARELWGPRLPVDDEEKLAKVLFRYDNPPGKTEVSGSQDAIGIVFPGLACAHYDGDYWPVRIDRVRDEETLAFVEDALCLVPLPPREDGFDVLSETDICEQNVRALADAAGACWESLLKRDRAAFGSAMRAAFEAQIALFPRMQNDAVAAALHKYRSQALGWKVTGAGGGGYLVLVTERPVPEALRVTVRRGHC